MPRGWMVQAAISAICLAIGYAIGTLGGSIVRRIRGDRRPLTAALTTGFENDDPSTFRIGGVGGASCGVHHRRLPVLGALAGPATRAPRHGRRRCGVDAAHGAAHRRARLRVGNGRTLDRRRGAAARPMEQPTAATVSGSTDSLVEWDDLGLQGREFVAHATSADAPAVSTATCWWWPPRSAPAGSIPMRHARWS